MRTFFCAATAVALFLQGCHAASAQRLSTTVVPAHYRLALVPDLKAAAFSGVESIDVMVKAPTRTVTLNAAEIEIQSVMATAGCFTTDQACTTNTVLQVPAISYDEDKQQATFTFPNEIGPGKLVLNIRYTGILNDQLRGFYLSKTAKRNYAVTQFEPTDARRAFPCFDEPAMKATFDVSLEIDTGDMAISNTGIVSDTPGPDAGKHTLTFGTTPKMSTYLIAFLVGDFQCLAGEQDGVALRVCATPDKVRLAPFALDAAKFNLHYYDTYFGIHFPLKKLDLIGIPDFEAGAMENFGAITFREDTLLVDPRTSALASQIEVAVDIAHEMAHQWFGDLVTLAWWDNVWLNEGFATWMETRPVAAMHPEWGIPEAVAIEEDNTLNVDAQPTTRSIRARADTPDEINEAFDDIAYGKAGDVLLMVENYLGEETFRKGVHAYLTAHEYGNATAEDFWKAETATSHKPVDKIMESVVAQPGAPVLNFGAPADGKVSVAQQRFFLSPSIVPDPRQKWTLPVCFKDGAAVPSSDATSEASSNVPPRAGWVGAAVTGVSPGPAEPASSDTSLRCDLLTPDANMLHIPASGLFFANAGGKGYYRSAYQPAQNAELMAHVESGLTPVERINLTGDLWAQVHANKATVIDYLNLVAALKSDPDAEVLAEAASGISAIDDRVASTQEERDVIGAWIRHNFEPEYEKLGAPAAGDTPNTRQLRAGLLSLLGYLGNDDDVVAQARKIADEYLADPDSVDPTLGVAALGVAAENGDAALFDKLRKIYETSTNPAERTLTLRLLVGFKDKSLLNRGLEYSVSSKVRNQDTALELGIALQIPENRDQAWSFIKSHWSQVQAQLTTGLGGLMVSHTGEFCTAEMRDDVKSFFAVHPVNAADAALRHSIEHIDGCIELRRLQEPNLKAWLAAQDHASK